MQPLCQAGVPGEVAQDRDQDRQRRDALQPIVDVEGVAAVVGAGAQHDAAEKVVRQRWQRRPARRGALRAIVDGKTAAVGWGHDICRIGRPLRHLRGARLCLGAVRNLLLRLVEGREDLVEIGQQLPSLGLVPLEVALDGSRPGSPERQQLLEIHDRGDCGRLSLHDGSPWR